MTAGFERLRAEGCLSDHLIDRWVGSELSADEVSSAAAHEERCALCQARVAEIRGFASAALPPLAAKVVPFHRARRRLVLSGGLFGAALAAGLAMFVVAPPGAGFRTKGAGPARLGFWVKHGDGVRAGGSGEIVQPGDALRFAYSSPAPAYVAVLSVDPRGAVSVYYPASGQAAFEAAGNEVPLPLSTVLDETTGTERLYGVFCPAAFDVAALRAALAASPSSPPVVAEGCSVDTVVIEKRPPR